MLNNNKNNDEGLVNITLRLEVAKRLKELAKSGDNDWCDVIVRLINYYEEDKNSIIRGAKRFMLILIIHGN
jgi:predicted CopG family antitoxin